MAAFVPFPNMAEVVLIGSEAGQQIVSVYNFQFDAPLTVTILTDLAQTVLDAWELWVAPIISTGLDINMVKAVDMTTASSAGVTVFAPAGLDGDVAEAPVQMNVALVLSQATDLRGRSYRGRMYQAGIPQTALASPGAVTEGYQTSFIAAYIGFFEKITDDSGGTHVVASRQSGGATRITGVTTPITQYSANVDLDSQRRRLFGRGA